MSSAAYVTAVLRFLQAYNAGDLEGCGQSMHPDIEWHTAVNHKGREEVRKYLEALGERYQKPQVRPDDFRETGGHVLMVVTFFDAEPGPEPAPDQRQAWIAHLGEDGTMRRVVAYPTPAEAARALDALTHKVHA
jgi:ketosteroid isomerase-like protein